MSINYLAVAKTVFEIEIKSLMYLSEMMDENFEKAVQLISQTAGKVIVSGIGKSGIAAQKIAASFSSIGTPSVFVSGSEASHGDLGTISSGDTMIIISNSGTSSELAEIIEYCKSISVPTISIVGNKNSFLYKEANVALLLPPLSEVALKVPSTSFTLTSVIGDALVACIVAAKKVTAEQYRKYHPGGKIGASLAKVEDLMRTGSSIPTIKSGALMSEALILMTTKSLGCVVVTDNVGNVLGIITDGDLRRHMASRLIDMIVDEVMTPGPKTIEAGLFVFEALDHMNKKKITNLIVAEDKKVVGIIHIHDCLKLGLEIVES